MQSSSHIITTNKATPNFYRPDDVLSLNQQRQSTEGQSYTTVQLKAIIKLGINATLKADYFRMETVINIRISIQNKTDFLCQLQ